MIAEEDLATWSQLAVGRARATEHRRKLCETLGVRRWRTINGDPEGRWSCAWCGRLSLERSAECWPLLADLPEGV